MFPKVMFVLMPLFAGVLTLLFIRRGRFYVEHLVFALHVHSAIYLALLPGALLGGFSTIIFGCVVFWQMYFGMLHVYGQGGFKTFLKFVVLVASYGATAMMCAGYVFIYALMN